MVYHNKFVVAVKVCGQVLREAGDTVTIPFGSEYSLLLKNLNSVRAKVKVSVDGQDATEGTWLVIRPNGSLELERFIRNGNLSAGNRFKFIERTGAIEQHRGIGVEDGLIRIEYKWEEVVHEHIIREKYLVDPVWPPHDWPPYAPPFPSPWRRPRGPIYSRHATFGASDVPSTFAASLQRCAVNAEQASDAGITVPGTESHQQFFHVPDFATDAASEVIVIKLRGQIGGKAVQQPVTVKTKQRCQTCGRQNQGAARFCSQCGTALEIV